MKPRMLLVCFGSILLGAAAYGQEGRPIVREAPLPHDQADRPNDRPRRMEIVKNRGANQQRVRTQAGQPGNRPGGPDIARMRRAMQQRMKAGQGRGGPSDAQNSRIRAAMQRSRIHTGPARGGPRDVDIDKLRATGRRLMPQRQQVQPSRGRSQVARRGDRSAGRHFAQPQRAQCECQKRQVPAARGARHSGQDRAARRPGRAGRGPAQAGPRETPGPRRGGHGPDAMRQGRGQRGAAVGRAGGLQRGPGARPRQNYQSMRDNVGPRRGRGAVRGGMDRAQMGHRSQRLQQRGQRPGRPVRPRGNDRPLDRD